MSLRECMCRINAMHACRYHTQLHAPHTESLVGDAPCEKRSNGCMCTYWRHLGGQGGSFSVTLFVHYCAVPLQCHTVQRLACSHVEVHMSCGSKASIASDSPCGNTVRRHGCCTTCWKCSIIARQTASNAASGQSSALQHAPISICDLQRTSSTLSLI